jgi:hypothetical protein
VRHQKVTRSKESVTHGLDLLKPVGSGEPLKRISEMLKMLNDGFRRMFVTVGGESDNVAEEDGNVRIPPWLNAPGFFQLSHCRGWQDCVKKIAEASALLLDLGRVGSFLVTQPLFLQTRAYPSPKQHLVERLW